MTRRSAWLGDRLGMTAIAVTVACASPSPPTQTPPTQAYYYAPPPPAPGPQQPPMSSSQQIEYDVGMELCPQGNGVSCEKLGLGLLDGTYGHKDPKEAAKYLELACDDKRERSCVILAGLYESGKGVSKDIHVAFKLYLKACAGWTADGCAGARRLSSNVGRMPYADPEDGVPEMKWHCNGIWCWQDPTICNATIENDSASCEMSTSAFCATIAKKDKVWWTCSLKQSTCQAGAAQLAADGGGVAGPCVATSPTPPGLLPGNDWYCNSGYGGQCYRDLAFCEANRAAYRQRCDPAATAACVIYYDQLQAKYASSCYSSLDSCNSGKLSLGMKDDFVEMSECFAVK